MLSHLNTDEVCSADYIYPQQKIAVIPNIVGMDSLANTLYPLTNNIIEWFDDVTKNAGGVQREILRGILEINGEVEYLKKWLGDINIHDMESDAVESLYTSLVPLASHADFEPYIQKISDGEELLDAPLITKQPLTTLSLSSGTTEGRQKFVPFTHHSSLTTLHIFRLASAFRSRLYPIKEGGRILEFIYSSKQYLTKGGLTVGTATTHYYESKEFKIKQEKTKCFTCSPPEVISGGDYKQSTYCHLLLGLFFSDDVEFITSTFAYSIVYAFSYFEEHWEDLCNDLEMGSLSTRMVTVPAMRTAVIGRILPRPMLSATIRAACRSLEGSGWRGMVPELWPNAKYVYSILTGAMQPYVKKLRHYAGDVPLVSADYGSTESWVGVNVDPDLPPEKVTFAAVPTFSYLEFIPLHPPSGNFAMDDYMEDEAVPLSKVKVGQQYEIVLTTFTGLYRCRLGDVILVTGFYNGTPKMRFLCRRKLMLTIHIDKNTENDLQQVVEKASQRLSRAGAELVDFTSSAYRGDTTGHYVIFWEIEGEAEVTILRECCKEMDLSFVDPGYVLSRKASTIGPLELHIVQKGTFNKILDYFIALGAALSQFKTPRCTSNQIILKILKHRTIQTVCSTAYTSNGQ